MKYKRQNAIIKIVKTKPVRTHDELIAELFNEGYRVTQATVSRDIKELGLIKVPSVNGTSVYSVPEPMNVVTPTRIDMVSDSVKEINTALHTVGINTFPGMASAVAAAIDGALKNDILGSIAGDDTVLVITRSESMAMETENRIKTLFKAE